MEVIFDDLRNEETKHVNQYIENINSNFEINKTQEEGNDLTDNSTNCTDTRELKAIITDREENTYTKSSKKSMGRKRKNENRETTINHKLREFNCIKKIENRFNIHVIEKICSIDKTFQNRIKKIPYQIYSKRHKNSLITFFSLPLKFYINQPVYKENLNKDIINELMQNEQIRNYLERNFLDVFYNDFVPILNKEYLDKNKIDDKEFEVWKKIIYYSPKKKKKEEYKNEYENYGFYQYFNEKNGRKAQIEYKILNKKTKRDSNSNIKSDNQFNDQKKTNQNVNYNSSLNNNENIPSSNNIYKDVTFNNDSNIVKTNQNVNSNSSLNNNENIPSSNNIYKDGTFNNNSNIVQTNQNVNYNSSLNNNENNIEFNETLNNYSFNLTEDNHLSNIPFLSKQISNRNYNDIYIQMFDKEISKYEFI